MLICVNTRDDGLVEVTGQRHRKRQSSRSAFWGTWDWHEPNLTAAVDPFGFQRMFYAVLPKGVAIADTVSELLAVGVNPALDDAAIATFLRMGYFIGMDIPFSSIRAFGPGATLQWTCRDGLRMQQRRPAICVAPSIRTSDALHGYIDRFRDAVRKCLPANPRLSVLPLSGGRDSRHIALELHRCGIQPGTVLTQRHMRYRSDEDARVANLVASALGWTHSVIAQSRDPLAVEHEKNRLFEGLVKEHAWMVPTGAHVRDQGLRHVFDGIAGDVLSNGLFCRPQWQAALQSQRLHEVFRHMSAGCTDDVLQCMLRPDLAVRWNADLAFAHWKAEFQQFGDEEDPIKWFMFFNRTRRAIAPLWQCLDPQIEVLAPYLDAEVFAHLASLPRRYFESQNFHDEAIALCSPQFAGIPYENKAVKADPAAHGTAMTQRVAQAPRYWGSHLIHRGRVRARLAAALLVPGAPRRLMWLGLALPQLNGLEQLMRSGKAATASKAIHSTAL